jgi:nicotinamidase-related amidase
VKEIAEEVHLLDHLRAIVAAALRADIRIFFVPHHRSEPGDYEHRKHLTHTQIATGKRQTFAKDSWGGTFHDNFQVQPGDIVIKEHCAQSGFANRARESRDPTGRWTFIARIDRFRSVMPVINVETNETATLGDLGPIYSYR